MSRNSFNAGPPDPIDFLRTVSDCDVHAMTGDAHRGQNATNPPLSPSRRQEAPARERPAPGVAWPYRENLSFTRSLIFYGAGAVTAEHIKACQNIVACRALRKKYFGGESSVVQDQILKESFGDDNGKDSNDMLFQMGKDGVMEVYHIEDTDKTNNLSKVPTVEEFEKDYQKTTDMVTEGYMRTYCFQRLQLLSSAFRTHVTMNAPMETLEQGNLLGTDFFRTLKVDNHIHAAGAPTARQFVNFVTHKLETESDTVISSDGKTLGEVFKEAGLDKHHLTIDAFDVLADYSVYQRFDNFNAKYSPFRMADLRRIFLKSNNHIEGRYFAELLKIVLNRHELSKGHVSGVELRLSIYGMERHEWDDLAEWMLKDWEGGVFPGPVVSKSNRWLVQIPRLWRIYKGKPGRDGSGFHEMLENIFAPMFEATLYPERKPKLAQALKHIVGIDSVDDEGAPEVRCDSLNLLDFLNLCIEMLILSLFCFPLTRINYLTGELRMRASTKLDVPQKSCILVAAILFVGQFGGSKFVAKGSRPQHYRLSSACR